MISDTDLATMSQAIKLRLSYYEVISYANILAESSIRYPVVEYLERRLSYKDIILEYANPVFQRRRCDLYIKSGNEETVFEFKYVRDTTSGLFQDYFDDILRLHYLHESGMQALFIVSGNPINFNNQFQNIKKQHTTQLKGKNKRRRLSGVYSQILSFSPMSPEIRFVANAIFFSENYKAFREQYRFIDKTMSHPDSITIQTRLIIIDNDGQQSVGIWEVK